MHPFFQQLSQLLQKPLRDKIEENRNLYHCQTSFIALAGSIKPGQVLLLIGKFFYTKFQILRITLLITLNQVHIKKDNGMVPVYYLRFQKTKQYVEKNKQN